MNQARRDLGGAAVDVMFGVEFGQIGQAQLAAVAYAFQQRFEQRQGHATRGRGTDARGFAGRQHVDIDGQVERIASGDKGLQLGAKCRQAAFPDLKFSDLFTDEGVKAVNQIYSNKCMHAASDTMNYYFKDGYNALLKTNQANALAWAEAVYKGSAQPVKPVAPVQIYYGSLDNVNPPAMGAMFQKQMCGLGGNVGRMELPGKQTHFDEPRGSQQFFLPWIKDRVAGKPLANGCPSS